MLAGRKLEREGELPSVHGLVDAEHKRAQLVQDRHDRSPRNSLARIRIADADEPNHHLLRGAKHDVTS